MKDSCNQREKRRVIEMKVGGNVPDVGQHLGGVGKIILVDVWGKTKTTWNRNDVVQRVSIARGIIFSVPSNGTPKQYLNPSRACFAC